MRGMSGAGRREPCPAEPRPPPVAAPWCQRGCLGLRLRKRGDVELRDQDGKGAIDLALEQGKHVCVWSRRDAQGWLPTDAAGGARRSLSFLTEDGTEGSVTSRLPEPGPLSSTRRSLLEEPQPGDSCGFREPPLWRGCPPEPPPLALAPWPHTDLGGSALLPQPLASSTLLSAGDELGEGPWSQITWRRTGAPPGALPKPSPGPSPQSPSTSQPQHCNRIPGACGAFRGGLSCSVACRSPRDGDILGAAAQHHSGVPWGPPVGWAGLGVVAPAALDLGTTVLEAGAGGCDPSSLGDSGGASELFVTAVETLEPGEAGGCPGAQHHSSPQPRAAKEPEPSEAPSPTRAATWELPPASPPNAGQVQGEDFWGGLREAPRCEDGSKVGDIEQLLVRLQGCSLRGSPPRTPEPPHSPACVAAGDVTPWELEPPRHCHVTPRTKSRLQASAAQLSTSSSSSLFDETLEMPRRPPRLRAPQGVPRDPATTLGHCIPPWGEDVSRGDGEGTGSLDDTEILPVVPSQPSVPPGASSSLSSSPTVLLVPGDHDHPQDSPSDTRGSPHATNSPKPRVLQGGSGWQDPSPLGTHQPWWPHGSFSRLLAKGSTTVEPGSSLSGCSIHRTGERPEDEARTEQRSPSAEATTSPEDAVVQDGRARTVPLRPLSDEALRRRLRALGDDPGPVTEHTRRLYLRRLEELTRGPRGRVAGHSPELVAALRTGHIPDCGQDELALAQQFDRPDRSQHWREGLLKSSFNYLLLDPRTTQNLPLRSHRLSPAECFRTFVKAIFYVGKGTRVRPYCHLAEALSQHHAGTQKGCPKVRRILEIWASGQGVVSVHCFQNAVPAEAYTREGCLVEALGLQTITNQRKGHCYGTAASWPAERRRRLGVHMLHRAMRIFLAEGERQLRPADIQGGH